MDDQQKLYYAIAGQIGTALGIYSNKLSMSAISTSTSPLPIAVVTALAAVVGSSVVTVNYNNKTSKEKDTLPLRYDPEAIAAYFEKRPLAVVSCLLEVIWDCSYIALGLAIDSANAVVKENEKRRAIFRMDVLGSQLQSVLRKAIKLCVSIASPLHRLFPMELPWSYSTIEHSCTGF